MAKGSLRSTWIIYGSGIAFAIAISIAIAILIQIGTSQTTAFLQQLELQQAAFNAKEFGERMGRFIGAGLALGLAGIGAGIAVGLAGAAAISAFTEKPEVFGRSFLIVVLGEGIAIYGIAIAILVLILGVP
ncbi:MAG: ATP synthase subunit C [Desulfurococcales archaeon]|jgi:V/A-type H+-transporting ATPase subunit K|nr:ATP synthase subunit C [Desulfurococcales archaeon]